jgi:hypothetical protein
MLDEVWTGWVRDWRDVLAAIDRRGSSARTSQLVIDAPVSDEELAALAVGSDHPDPFLDVLATRSAHVRFHWAIDALADEPDQGELPFDGETSVWGGCHVAQATGALWSAAHLAAVERRYRDGVEGCWGPMLRDRPGDPYASVWLDKLPFIEVADGDAIAFDLAPGPRRGRVVYLCHDDFCAVHGEVLGQDFVDFMTRWSRIGCVGPEGWLLEAFVDDGAFAEPDSPAVRAWRRWLGMGEAS